MKKYAVIAMGLALCASSMSFAADNSDKVKQARESLVRIYNTIESISDENFANTLLAGAQDMERKGLNDNAQALRALAGHVAIKTEVLANLKSKIDDSSVNGIGFIVYLMLGPSVWCSAPGHTSRGYEFDWGCVVPWTIISILTLDGSPASAG